MCDSALILLVSNRNLCDFAVWLPRSLTMNVPYSVREAESECQLGKNIEHHVKFVCRVREVLTEM